MLTPPTNRRERILIYGNSYTGKTNSWVNTALWVKRTKATSHFYVIDTDRAWEANNPGGLEDYVSVADCANWDQVKEHTQRYMAKGGKDDFLVVDMADRYYEWAQTAFLDKAFGRDIDEFFLAARKEGFNPGGDYGKNWDVIKKMNATIAEPLIRFPGHVIGCAGIKKIWENEKDIDFGKAGYRPDGHVKLPHFFHSVLMSQQTPSGWVISSVKERGDRERVQGKKVDNFTVEYLVEVGGWQL